MIQSILFYFFLTYFLYSFAGRYLKQLEKKVDSMFKNPFYTYLLLFSIMLLCSVNMTDNEYFQKGIILIGTILVIILLIETKHTWIKIMPKKIDKNDPYYAELEEERLRNKRLREIAKKKKERALAQKQLKKAAIKNERLERRLEKQKETKEKLKSFVNKSKKDIKDVGLVSVDAITKIAKLREEKVRAAKRNPKEKVMMVNPNSNFIDNLRMELPKDFFTSEEEKTEEIENISESIKEEDLKEVENQVEEVVEPISLIKEEEVKEEVKDIDLIFDNEASLIRIPKACNRSFYSQPLIEEENEVVEEPVLDLGVTEEATTISAEEELFMAFKARKKKIS